MCMLVKIPLAFESFIALFTSVHGICMVFINTIFSFFIMWTLLLVPAFIAYIAKILPTILANMFYFQMLCMNVFEAKPLW